MRYLTLIVTLPLSLFILLFVVANRARVDVFLYPGADGVTWPLYSIALLMLVLGFIGGSLIVFIYAQRTRIKLWQESRRAARLEKELDLLQQKNLARTQATEPPPSDPIKKFT